MKTGILKKLRKDAKRYIYLYPCGFEESYEQCFSHDTAPVKIHVVCDRELMEKHETGKDYAEVDGVGFDYTIFSGVALSFGWQGGCGLNKAKNILKKLRREYILQEVGRLRAVRLFKNNRKEYENFKKYIKSL